MPGISSFDDEACQSFSSEDTEEGNEGEEEEETPAETFEGDETEGQDQSKMVKGQEVSLQAALHRLGPTFDEAEEKPVGPPSVPPLQDAFVPADPPPQCCCPFCEAESSGRGFQTLLLELAAEHRRALAQLRSKLDSRKSQEEAQLAKGLALGTQLGLLRDQFASSNGQSETLPDFGEKNTRDSRDTGTSTASPNAQGGASPSKGRKRDRRNQRLRGLAMRHLGSMVETPFQRIVNNNTFELVCCLVIVCNIVVMALEFQYLGCDGGYTIQHADCPEPPWQALPWAGPTFTFLSAFFMFVFVCEFLLRLAALQLSEMICNGWLWFDFAMLMCGAADLIERFSAIDFVRGINPTVLRAARVLRMLRMMKVLKPGLLRVYHSSNVSPIFPSLFLIVKSLQASRQALFWSVLILLFTMSSVGMLMHQLLLSFLEDPGVSEADRREVFEYFGTYTRMITTMFELTLGNWAPPSRLLMSKHSQYWGLFVVVYRCIFCFALVSVTNAVFITETNRVASSDDEVIMMCRERARRACASKLEELFNELDESGDGFVSWDEFSVLLNDEVMRDYLITMDLPVGDLEGLFHLLDDGDGQVQSSEFIERVQTVKGTAQNINMLQVQKMVRQMYDKLEGVDQVLRENDLRLLI